MNLPVKFDDTNKDSWIQFDTDGDNDDDGDDIQYNKIDENSKKIVELSILFLKLCIYQG